MNENANENHAVQNETEVTEEKTVSNAIGVSSAYAWSFDRWIYKEILHRHASSIISEGRIRIMNLFFPRKLDSPVILKSTLDSTS